MVTREQEITNPKEVELPKVVSDIILEYCAMWGEDNIRRVRQLVLECILANTKHLSPWFYTREAGYLD